MTYHNCNSLKGHWNMVMTKFFIILSIFMGVFSTLAFASKDISQEGFFKLEVNIRYADQYEAELSDLNISIVQMAEMDFNYDEVLALVRINDLAYRQPSEYGLGKELLLPLELVDGVYEENIDSIYALMSYLGLNTEYDAFFEVNVSEDGFSSLTNTQPTNNSDHLEYPVLESTSSNFFIGQELIPSVNPSKSLRVSSPKIPQAQDLKNSAFINVSDSILDSNSTASDASNDLQTHSTISSGWKTNVLKQLFRWFIYDFILDWFNNDEEEKSDKEDDSDPDNDGTPKED